MSENESDVVNDVLGEIVSTEVPSETPNEVPVKKHIGGTFHPWGKNAGLPEDEYYIQHVNYSLNVLKQYLERLLVFRGGTENLDPVVRAEMTFLYCDVLKATL